VQGDEVATQIILDQVALDIDGLFGTLDQADPRAECIAP
jgi:hypothetical protein